MEKVPNPTSNLLATNRFISSNDNLRNLLKRQYLSRDVWENVICMCCNGPIQFEKKLWRMGKHVRKGQISAAYQLCHQFVNVFTGLVLF